MHDQQDGPPAEPPQSVPPPPAFPPPSPGDVSPQPVHARAEGYPQPDPGQWYPQEPGPGSPAIPRSSRRISLWVALGVVGALLLGGGAYALTSSGDSARPAAVPGTLAMPDGSAGSAGTGSSATAGSLGGQPPVAGNQPSSQLHLPDSFMGMARNDHSNMAKLIRQESQALAARYPDVHSTTTAYVGGTFDENYVTVMAFEKDSAISDQGRSQILAGIWRPANAPGMTVVHGQVSNVDPGSLGGTLQCAETYTKTATTDAFGNSVYSTTQCAWVDVNTVAVIGISDAISGQDVTKGAAIAQEFRAAAESRR